MTGQLTMMAATTGNPYMIGAGMALDITQSLQNKARLEAFNKKVRNLEVAKVALENRQANQQQSHLDDLAADQKFEYKIQQLKQLDRVQMSAGENGVQGQGIQRVVGALLSQGARALGKVDQNLANSRSALAIGTRARQQNLNMKIDSLEKFNMSEFYRPLFMGAFGVIGGMAAEKATTKETT